MRPLLLALALALMTGTANAQNCPPGKICPRPVLGSLFRETRQPTRHFAQATPTANCPNPSCKCDPCYCGADCDCGTALKQEAHHARPFASKHPRAKWIRPVKALKGRRACRRGGCG
jgi:hypothetical protein